MTIDTLESLRKQIDQIDNKIITLFGKRFSLVKEIGEYKKNKNIPVQNKKREGDKLQKLLKLGNTKNISESFIKTVWKNVFLESYRLEK